MHRSCVLSAALLLSACSVSTAVNRNLSAIAPAKGLVVFSTGAAETSTSASTGLRLAKATTGALSPSSGTDIVIDYSLASYEFPEEHGRVRMLELDPGEYCLRPASMNPYLTLKNAPDIAFRVEAGKVSYLGSVYLGRGRSFEIRDRRARDLKSFFDGNPGLKAEKVETVQATLVRECRPRG